MTTNVDAVYAPDLSTRYALPVFLGRLAAGFPSPADDYICLLYTSDAAAE